MFDNVRPAAPDKKKRAPRAATPTAGQTDLFGTFDVPEAAKPAVERAKSTSEKVATAAIAAKRPRKGAIFNPAPVLRVGKEKIPALSAGVDRPAPLPQLSLLDFAPEAQPIIYPAEQVKADVVKASQGRPRKTRSRKLLVDPIGALTDPADTTPVASPAELELPPAAVEDVEALLRQEKDGKPLPDREVPAEPILPEGKRLAGEIEAQAAKERGEEAEILHSQFGGLRGIVEHGIKATFGGRAGWGPVARKTANQHAKQVLATLKKEQREATPEELEILKGYSGHGGVGGDSFGNLNEYFTPTGIAGAIWGALAASKCATRDTPILEPSVGTGAFLDTCPFRFAQTVGVELDPTSAGVARALFEPRGEGFTKIETDCFERFAVRDARYWPIIVGNPPFGARGKTAAADPEKRGMPAESYFLDTAVDKLLPGGVVAMVLPTQVISGDGEDRKAFRERLLKKAELIGAWRLPSGAFAQSGTSIATDVVFLRKWQGAEVLAALTTDELAERGYTIDPEVLAGNYFRKHPGQVFGVEQEDAEFNGQIKVEGKLTAEDLHRLAEEAGNALRAGRIANNPLTRPMMDVTEGLSAARRVEVEAARTGPSPYRWEEGTLRDFEGIRHIYRKTPDGFAWRRIDAAEELENLSPTDKEQVTAAGKIGEGLSELQAAIRTGDDPAKTAALREQLRRDVVTWRDRYGVPAGAKKLLGKLANQTAAAMFAGSIKPDGEVCDLLLRQVDPQRVALPEGQTETDSPEVAVDMAAREGDGIINLTSAAQNLGGVDIKPIEAVLLASPAYFLDEEGNWLTKERFLSGYVYERRSSLANIAAVLEQAAGDAKRAADLLQGMEGRQAAGKLGLARNFEKVLAKIKEGVAELDKVRNATPFEEIRITLRDGWVPIDALNRFLQRHFHSHAELVREAGVYTLSVDGREIKGADNGFWDGHIGAKWRAVINLLNRERLGDKQKDAVYGIDEDYRRFLMEGDRGEWRGPVEDAYNRAFHAYRAAAVSQDAVQLGKAWHYGEKVNGEYVGRTPHGYQYQGIRWLQRQGKGILSDGVGLGKTLVVLGHAAAEAAIAKEKGLAHKPLIVVPKSLLMNWQAEILEVLPQARILLIGEKMIPDKKNPGKMVGKEQSAKEKGEAWARAALNDWDFVLCSRESFQGLDLSIEHKMERWEDLAAAEVSGAAKEEKESKKRVKSEATLDKAKARAKARFEAEDAERRILGAPLFEDVGLTHLYFDEGHAFKNLYVPKGGYSGVKYLGSAQKAKRSVDMDLKCRVFEQLNPGRGPILATATPVKNSPLEVYTMMSHVAPEVFTSRGIDNVESFLDRYAVIRREVVPNTRGQLVETDVVAGFKGLRELRDICATYLMIRDAKTVGLRIPAEDLIPEAVDLTPNQQATMARLRQVLEDLLNGKIVGVDDDDLYVDESTAIAAGAKPGRRKKGAEEDGDASSSPSAGITGAMGKLNELEKLEDKSILRVLHAMHVVSLDPSYDPSIMADYAPSQEGGPPQDLRSPKLEKLVANCKAALDLQTAEKPRGQVIFCDIIKVEYKIRDMLIAAGVPAERIAMINAKDAPTITERQEQARRFQKGDAWVIIGNTATMGEGVNLQKRGSDIHHADIPWDPGSMEQRNGRVVRQGNPIDKVGLRTYLGKGSFDGYRLAGLLGKGQWLQHLWHGTTDEIEIPAEVQGLNRDSLFVFASADPDAASAELEEGKKRQAVQKRDALYQADLTRYASLRSMWRAHKDLLRQAATAAEDPKRIAPDETKVQALVQSIAQSRRILGDSIYFPHKDALTDEALDGPAVINPANGLLIKAGMSLMVPRAMRGHSWNKPPTAFRVTDVDARAGKVTGFFYGSIDTLADAREPVTLLIQNLGKAAATLIAPEEESRLIVDEIARLGPSQVKELPADFRAAHEDALRSAARAWLLSQDAKVSASSEGVSVVGWSKDAAGGVYPQQLEQADALQLARKGPGVFDLVVGGKVDKERLTAFRSRLADSLQRGVVLPQATIDLLRGLGDLGLVPGGLESWLESELPEDVSKEQYVNFHLAVYAGLHPGDGREKSTRAWREGKWADEQKTKLQNKQLAWAAYKARVGEETAADTLVGGLSARADWVDQPETAASADVTTARRILQTTREQIELANRWFAVPTAHRDPLVILRPTGEGDEKVPYTVSAVYSASILSSLAGKVNGQIYRPGAGVSRYETGIILADLGLTPERVEALEQKELVRINAEREEQRKLAEAQEQRQREEADRVLAAKAEKQNALSKMLRGKVWQATKFEDRAQELFAGLSILVRDREDEKLVATEQTVYGATNVRFAFGGQKELSPKKGSSITLIRNGGRGPAFLRSVLVGAGWFFDDKWTNWSAPRGMSTDEQRETLARVAQQLAVAQQTARELSAAGVTAESLAGVDVSLPGAAAMIIAAQDVVKSLPAGAPLRPLAGLLGRGPAILVGTRPSAGR
jgi:hypothetical protein